MRRNERMRKYLSILLCLCMLLQNAPVMAFAATTDDLCEHHTAHTADCGYVAAVAGSDCTHSHDGTCGYAEAVAEVKCACEATDENGTLVHTEGCGYVAPVAGADCTHNHDEHCGYAAPVEGHPCHYECAACAEGEKAPSGRGLSAELTGGENPPDSGSLPQPPAAAAPSSEGATGAEEVCNCGTDDAAIHATTCAVYVAPENPQCFCVEKCAEPNIWCDVCGFDVSACQGGADQGVPYEDATITGVSIEIDGVEYNSSNTSADNPAVVTSNTQSIIYTVTGRNLNDASANDWWVYYAKDRIHAVLSWDISEDGTTATANLTYALDSFADTVSAFEIYLDRTKNDERFDSGVYVIYDTSADKELLPIPNPVYLDVSAISDGDAWINGVDVTYYDSLDNELDLESGELNNGVYTFTNVPDGAVQVYFYDIFSGECTRIISPDEGCNMFILSAEAADGFIKSGIWGTCYTVTIAETTNGTVTADKATAVQGDTVTLTVEPDAGYLVDTVTYNGTAITPVEGVYSFPMPAGAVTVSVAFTPCGHEAYADGKCALCGALLVAKVDEGYFTTFMDAYFAWINSNSTLTLLEDAQYDSEYTLEIPEKSHVLDLNGFTLDLGDKYINHFGNKLTIQGKAGSNIISTADYCLKGSDIYLSGTVQLEGKTASFYVSQYVSEYEEEAITFTSAPQVSYTVLKEETGLFALPGEGVTLDTGKFTSAKADYVVIKNADGQLELVACDHSGNTNKTYTRIDDDIHSLYCSVCGLAADTGEHTGGTATCEAKAACEICGAGYGEMREHKMYPADGKCMHGCGKLMAVASTTVGDDTTYHETLYAAIRAVSSCTPEDKATVQLLESLTLPYAADIHSGVFTLDLNSKMLASDDFVLEFSGSADVTVRNGTINCTHMWNYPVYIVGGTVTLEDCSIIGGDYGVLVDSDGTVIIRNSSVTGNTENGVLVQAGTATIENSTIEGSDMGVVTIYGIATISGGSVTGGSFDLNGDGITLTLNAEGKGTTFPGGIYVGNCNLENLIADDLAYWQDGRLVILTSGQEEISGGDVTVKKACDHTGNTNKPADAGNGKHGFECSVCGITITEDHTDTYSADGSTITESCSVNCGHETTAVISAANATYNGTEQMTATVAYSEGWQGGELTVIYENNTNAGTATASITIDGVAASVEFTIDKKELTPIVSGSVTKTYDGTTAVPENHVLYIMLDGIVIGDDISATASYAYGGADAGTTKINATNITLSGADAGNYTLKATSASADVGTINKAASSVTKAPEAITGLKYNGQDQALITPGEAEGGKLLYSVNGSTWSENVPTMRNPNEYHIYYKVVGDSNHTDYDDGGIKFHVTIGKADMTVTAGDQTITYGKAISADAFTADDPVDGHTVTVTLTPSTTNVTADGTITPSAVITVDGYDVARYYNVSLVPGKLVIKPDTSGIDALTTDNVTSANEEDIKAVQEMLENADSLTEEWEAIGENCDNLLDRIEEVEAENERIADAISGFDLTTIKSSDEETIAQLVSDIEDQLATDNLTDEERAALEDLKTKGENLIARIDGTEALIGKIDEEVAGLDEESVKSTDKATLEQVIEDAQTLIDSGNVTESEKEALVKIQEDAQALIQVIEDTAAENQELTDQAAAFDEETVNSTDLEDLEQLAEKIEDLLDTDNLTEEERTALEAVQDQVDGMIETIEDTTADRTEASETIEALAPETVTSDDQEDLEQAIETIDQLLQDDHLTEDERKALEEAKAEAEELLEKIESVQDALDTENTEQVENVTADNVKPEDKETLEDAKADLEKALEDNADNYTEDEKKAIQDEIQRIEDAVTALENVEDVTDAITQLPETVEPDDEEAAEKILDAKEAYDELTDHEKSLVDEDTKEKLDDLVAALTAYDIIKGDGGKWTKGSSSGLSFTANGPFSKFVGIEVDGKEVNEKHYDAKAGSTIITLKSSFLKWRSVGEHTITVLYTDGETSGTFKILAASSTPTTGDDSNIMLWSGVLGVSTLGLVVLLIDRKKKRSAK